MTISSTNRKAGPFIGNGVTTTFPFTFKVFTAADLLVVQAVTATGTETVKTLGADYTVSLNADQNANPGGTIAVLIAPPAGQTLTATSQMANLQSMDLTNAGGFYPAVLNNAMDRVTIQVQQLAEGLGRAVKVPISSTAAPTEYLSTMTALKDSAAVSAGAAAGIATAFGNVQGAVDAATTQAGIATTGAGTATTQAGIAIAQAGIATTQAGLATTNGAAQVTLAAAQAALATTNGAAQVTLAANQVTLATTAKTAAEGARDAALIQAGVYTTEALGRAAVADGVAFKVQGNGDVAAFEYRRTNSTTSVLIASYPSVTALNNSAGVNLWPDAMFRSLRTAYPSGSLNGNLATVDGRIRVQAGAALSFGAAGAPYSAAPLVTAAGAFSIDCWAYADELGLTVGDVVTLYVAYSCASGSVKNSFFHRTGYAGAVVGSTIETTVAATGAVQYASYSAIVPAGGTAFMVRLAGVAGNTAPVNILAVAAFNGSGIRAMTEDRATRFQARTPATDSVTSRQVKSGAITPDRTSFMLPGKNMFNKDSVTVGVSINTGTGSLDVSGWPCHLETGKKVGKHSIHEPNRWTLWKRREWSGANTAPNSGPRCFRRAARPMPPWPR